VNVKVLLVHNYYQQPGGEDMVFEAERALLERMGHKVVTFVEGNARLDGIHPLRAAVEGVWSREAQRRLRRFIKENQPDVAHFHNTFLRISPSAYYACKENGVPVVQTLHNYRLICPGALLMRNGKVCEDCVGKAVPWPGVVHGCWRRSRSQTAVVVSMLTLHRWLKTWQEQVDIYIALTSFARQKFIEGGIPPEKIVVKPNLVAPDPGMGEARRKYALFVGRLSPEKGVRTLLAAWSRVRRLQLKVIGDGPLIGEMRSLVSEHALKQVEVMGRCPRNEVFQLMKGARFSVFPSEWYEGFPMTIAEAFACATPVITSRLGAMVEIIEDGRTGLHFTPGDSEDLASKAEWAWSHPERMREMGREARREYERKYTPERNYEMLMEIYHKAMDRT